MKIVNKLAQFPLKHLTAMESLNKEVVFQLFEGAQYFLENSVLKKKNLNNLREKQVVNLFFEASTRTHNSFTIAARRLNAIVINPFLDFSSKKKGESLLDTVLTLEALGTDLFVVRHPERNIASFIASKLKTGASIINAGDGENEHPTQTLLDLFTIHKHKPNLREIKVAIIGDILHSRVARSLVKGLKIMGVAKVNMIAPKSLLPKKTDQIKVEIYSSLQKGLKDVDVIVALRIQKERMKASLIPDPAKYYHQYGLTQETLSFAKSDAIVMHPGPVNRGVEIDSSIVNGKQSVILEQVTNGLAMRMSVMDRLLNQ